MSLHIVVYERNDAFVVVTILDGGNPYVGLDQADDVEFVFKPRTADAGAADPGGDMDEDATAIYLLSTGELTLDPDADGSLHKVGVQFDAADLSVPGRYRWRIDRRDQPGNKRLTLLPGPMTVKDL